MAGDMAASRRRLERSSVELEHKHQEVEGRRRYVETILERHRDRRRLGRRRRAASARGIPRRRVCSASMSTSPGCRRPPCSVAGAEAARRTARSTRPRADRDDLPPQDVSITRDGRELHLAVMTTPLRRDDGGTDGTVVVFDDVSPLIRAQKVAAWREVARRLAHEIKNPLTPIQLCAERLRRHFTQAPEPTRALVDECTTTIVGEVESLKGLVDEFSQFARMPAPRAVPTDLHALLDDALALYRGLLHRGRIPARSYGAGLPQVSVDPEQIRRVVINLVDNAIEAMDRAGRDRYRDRSTTARTASCASSWPTTAPAFRRPSATSCFCRTTRRSSAAAASAWPSSAASSPSTAAPSTWPTTRRAARGSRSSCRH